LQLDLRSSNSSLTPSGSDVYSIKSGITSFTNDGSIEPIEPIARGGKPSFVPKFASELLFDKEPVT
jgi:hypothetical protein